jgi:hypothetical protein
MKLGTHKIEITNNNTRQHTHGLISIETFPQTHGERIRRAKVDVES